MWVHSSTCTQQQSYEPPACLLTPGIKVDDARQAHEAAIANGAEGVLLTNSIQ